MQMSSNKELSSLTLGSAHEKFDVWTRPKISKCNFSIRNLVFYEPSYNFQNTENSEIWWNFLKKCCLLGTKNCTCYVEEQSEILDHKNDDAIISMATAPFNMPDILILAQITGKRRLVTLIFSAKFQRNFAVLWWVAKIHISHSAIQSFIV